MKTTTIDRVASWSVDEDGIATFRYQIDGRKFTFCVTRSTMQEVLRDIGRLAANPVLPLDWNDAAYLTALIRDVMAMLEPIEPLDSRAYIGGDTPAVIWTITMFGCSAALMVTLFVFVLWGA